MVPKPKQDITRKTDIERLNRMLYGPLSRITDTVVRVRLTLAVVEALTELENVPLHSR